MSTTIEASKTLNLALQLDTDQRASWLSNLFQPYVSSFDSRVTSEVTDDLDWRFLGMSNLKSSAYGVTEVAFFELFEPIKKEQDHVMIPTSFTEDSLTPTPSATATMVSSPMVTDESDITTVIHSQDFNLESKTLAEYKKHTIVISLDTRVFKPSKRQPYYIFPTDAIVEKVSQTPPYELFCSFHALDSIHKQQQDNGGDMNTSIEYNNSSSLTKRQCYTDFPSSPLLSDKTPDVKMEQAIKDGPLTTHVSLSGISKELYLIIKNSVERFEVAYEKMIQLMKLHTEGVSHRCAELLLVDHNSEVQTKKTNKGKRKGSYQQRQTSPRTTATTAITTTNATATTVSISSTSVLSAATSSLSSKAKSITSTTNNTSNPGTTTTVSKQSPPAPSPPTVGTTPSSNSTPITLSSTHQRQNTANGTGRKCAYCGSKTTPMWRRGPEGAGTLCNACGVKWKHGKILCGKQPGPDHSVNNGLTSAPTTSKSTNGCGSNITAEKKRKQQHDELKLKKDKRIKMQRQQQQQQQQQQQRRRRNLLQKGQSLNGLSPKDEGLDSNDDDGDDDNNDEEEDNFSYGDDEEEDDDNDDNNNNNNNQDSYDEDEDERMKHNIVAARHLTLHESPQEYQHPYYTSSSSSSSLPESHSRPRSMTSYTENDNYLSPYQQQQQQQPWGQEEQAILQGFQTTTTQQQQQSHPPPYYLQYNEQRQPYYLPYNEQHHQYRPRRHTADVSVLERGPWGDYPLSIGVDAVEAATVLTLLKRSSQT